jgi:hypothetical protein
MAFLRLERSGGLKLDRELRLSGWRAQQDLLNFKRAMRDSLVLMSTNQEQPFFIVTDASDYAVGACL